MNVRRSMNGVRKRYRAAVDRKSCVACGCCVKVCPLQAIKVVNGVSAYVDLQKCVGCGRCVSECPASIIELTEAEYEKAMV